MELTDSEKNTLSLHLEENWTGSHQCPICQVDDWKINDRSFKILDYAPTVPGTTPVLPIIAMACSNCGYLLLFNAIQIFGRTLTSKEPDDA